jgi:hypothetical protein
LIDELADVGVNRSRSLAEQGAHARQAAQVFDRAHERGIATGS